MMKNKKFGWNKVLAVSFTILIIQLLVFMGPAQGFTLDLDLDDNRPKQGEEITFTAEIDIEGGERLPVEELILKIDGEDSVFCKFDAVGNPISGCDGISIKRMDSSDYSYGYMVGNYGYGYNFGYGYGFGSGKLIYTITLDTGDYDVGRYTMELVTTIGGSVFSTGEDSFRIKAANDNNDEENYCVTEWICSEWSTCINGVQTRTCNNIVLNCDASYIPKTVMECNSGIVIEDGDGPLILNSLNKKSSGIDFGNFKLGNGLVVLLFLNCVITAINIVIKVRQLKRRARRIRRIRRR